MPHSVQIYLEIKYVCVQVHLKSPYLNNMDCLVMELTFKGKQQKQQCPIL